MVSEHDAYALKSDEECERRKGMLGDPHIRPLCEYLEKIRAKHDAGTNIPLFDPCDGGINARVLFLLETPGRKAHHSGYVSRNNPDKTAQNMLKLMEEAGIDRKDTLIWNVVPAYIGDEDRIKTVSPSELKEALPHLEGLIKLLQKLEAVVLLGSTAQKAKPDVKQWTHVPITEICHPSQRVFNRWSKKRQESVDELRKLAGSLAG